MAVLTPPAQTQKIRNTGTTILALAALVALLYFGQALFVTLAIALIIAFILEPGVNLLMKVRLPRPVASFVVCVLALLVLYLAGLGFYTQVLGLYRDLPAYSQRIEELVEAAATRLEEMERSVYRLIVPRRLRGDDAAVQPAPPPPQPATARRRRSAEPPAPVTPPVQEVRILPERSPLRAYVYAHLGSVYQVLLMASFVPFLVYFMLSWRDHIHRSFLQLFEGQDRLVAGKSMEGIAAMVRAFVVGNFVLWVILAVVSSLLFWLFKLPYPLLTGPLSGLLSLVPYIGLPLAMVPPFFAALTVHQTMTAYLMLGSTVAVLHLLALNLLYPKIVGSRVHLNPLVVTIALMAFGVLWGAIGLVLAIPIVAGIKAVCDNVTSLQPYGRLMGD
ncbi:MAG: AI-2E family transporter [Bryobacterales bacterium]|nr:AI-2E family transporter [Bryobacteraceae bacterium]MDW8354346.1 AI-2E family transporter [Bryobacterales bacterium]